MDYRVRGCNRGNDFVPIGKKILCPVVYHGWFVQLQFDNWSVGVSCRREGVRCRITFGSEKVDGPMSTSDGRRPMVK